MSHEPATRMERIAGMAGVALLAVGYSLVDEWRSSGQSRLDGSAADAPRVSKV